MEAGIVRGAWSATLQCSQQFFSHNEVLPSVAEEPSRPCEDRQHDDNGAYQSARELMLQLTSSTAFAASWRGRAGFFLSSVLGSPV